jgi:predicted NAD/FAD-dependent oxidoreductase
MWIVVVGAGLGVSAAVGLRRVDHEVALFERGARTGLRVSVGLDRGRTVARFDDDRGVLSPEVDEAAESRQ